jgi:hypothetical protein
MGPIVCPETSVPIYQSTLRNIPESEDLISIKYNIRKIKCHLLCDDKEAGSEKF